MEFPKDLLYTPEHEWIRVDGGKGVIGISEFAQDQLGDIVFVELPGPAGDAHAAASAVKARAGDD